MNRRRRMLSSNLCCRFETVPHCEKKQTCKHEGIVKKKFFSLFCTSVGRQSENREVRKIAEKLRKIAENCEKLRKIAKNCEIAENCEKLRTSISPPPLTKPPPSPSTRTRVAWGIWAKRGCEEGTEVESCWGRGHAPTCERATRRVAGHQRPRPRVRTLGRGV